MNRTNIEWTTFSANPLKYRDAAGNVVWGCIKTSPGCAKCYSEALANRYGRGGQFSVATMRGLTPFLDEKELRRMLTYKPASGERCFVGDMTDLFGDWVPDDLLDRLFAVFALRPDVTWQVLTKRAERMAEYLGWTGDLTAASPPRDWQDRLAPHMNALEGRSPDGPRLPCHWPLPNVYCGVSVEDQQRADERMPLLLQTPAAVRFLSCEPLLGAVDLRPKAPDAYAILGKFYSTGTFDPSGMGPAADRVLNCFPRIDWVIVGGESGHEARPMHPDWARSIRDQCRAAGVAFFFKQWGEWHPTCEDSLPVHTFPDGRRVWRVGKKRAGRLLDGREWGEFPKGVA